MIRNKTARIQMFLKGGHDMPPEGEDAPGGAGPDDGGGEDPMAGKLAAAQDFLSAIESKDAHAIVQACGDMFKLFEQDEPQDGGDGQFADGGMVGGANGVDGSVPGERFTSWPRATRPFARSVRGQSRPPPGISPSR